MLYSDHYLNKLLFNLFEAYLASERILWSISQDIELDELINIINIIDINKNGYLTLNEVSKNIYF